MRGSGTALKGGTVTWQLIQTGDEIALVILPKPGGGAWLLLLGIGALESAGNGFVEGEAREEIRKWG